MQQKTFQDFFSLINTFFLYFCQQPDYKTAVTDDLNVIFQYCKHARSIWLVIVETDKAETISWLVDWKKINGDYILITD